MESRGQPAEQADSPWLKVPVQLELEAAPGVRISQGYMAELRQFLAAEKQAGKTIYPPGPDIFNAFNLTPFERVKVVILGQDPYHGPDVFHGLCFQYRRASRRLLRWLISTRKFNVTWATHRRPMAPSSGRSRAGCC